MNQIRISQLQRYVLALTLFLVATLATMSSFITPLFEPPDELQHYQFIRHLVDRNALPVQMLDGPISQSHQPPLYYLGGALLIAGIDDPQTLPKRNPFWAYNAAEVGRDNKLQFLKTDDYVFPYTGTALVMHILRLWSVLLSLGTVTAVWLLGRAIWPRNPEKVVLMLAIGVLNPMFLYIAGAVNNDNMIVLWGAIILWLVVKALRDDFSRRTTVLIGLVWGLALLSKLTGLILVVPWGSALLWTAWRKQDFRWFISRLAVVAALALGLAGWWYIRNAIVYDDPLALQVVLDVWGERGPEKTALAYLWPDVRYSWTNFWGRFGYGQIPLPDVIYQFFLLLCGFALLGGLIWLVKRAKNEKVRWAVWQMLITASLAYGAGLFYYIYRNTTGANGRYIFPALPALAALMTAGFSVWFDRWRRPFIPYVTLTAIIAGIAIYTTTSFLPRTYARPTLLTETEAMAQVERPADFAFGEGIRLLGTAVSPSEVVAGETVNITSCWQTIAAMNENYTRFIRLLDHEQNSLGQRDTHPGLGTFPTSLWQPGDIFCDTTPIPVAKNLAWPTVAEMELGYHSQESGLLSVTPVDRAIIGQIKIRPSTTPPLPSPQHELAAQFMQNVTLIGYTWSSNNTSIGETISIELIWQAAGPLDHSYTVFTHLLDANGQIIAQDDDLPRDGAYPTTFWEEGDMIVDTHTFLLPANTPPGPTTLRVGLYLLEDYSRLPRITGSEHPDWVEFSGPTTTTAHD